MLKGKVGKKPIFTDSEVITLVLAQDYIPYPSETQYIEFMRANYLALFPKLWIRANSIGERVAYAFSWKNYAAIGFCTSTTICEATTCWIPNQFLFSDTNGANLRVIFLAVPIMDIVPAAIWIILATSWLPLQPWMVFLSFTILSQPTQMQKLAPKWLDRSQQNFLISTAEKALNAAAQTESAKMLAQRDLTIIQTLLNTGLRIGELCDLTHVDVMMSPKKGKIIVRQGKGERRREIPMNAETR